MFMFVHFTIYNTEHNPSKNFIVYHQKCCFSIVMGFENANNNEFHGYGNISKGVHIYPA